MPITLEHYKLIYMLIRLLFAHETIKRVCKISHLNSKRLLRKLQKMLGGYFISPHPVYTLFFFNSPTGHTPQRILTRDGSNDAFSPKEVPFWG